MDECKNMLFFKESSHLQRITIARSTLVKDETFKQWFGIVSYSIQQPCTLEVLFLGECYTYCNQVPLEKEMGAQQVLAGSYDENGL